MKNYTIKYLVELFAEHSIKAEKNNEKTIEMFKENNPGEPLPEHMQDDFNICDAFCAICKEILELKNKV